MPKTTFLASFLAVLFLAAAVSPPAQAKSSRPVDLTRAAQEVAQAQVSLTEPLAFRLMPLTEIGFGRQACTLGLTDLTQQALNYQRRLGYRFHLTMKPQAIGPGPKLEFRPNTWLRFWGGPLYDQKLAQLDVLIALQLKLWVFNL